MTRTPRPSRELWGKLRPQARRMRHASTAAEDALWAQLRRKAIDGAKFRRQHAIGRFIVDFFCPRANLVVEVDGDVHAGRESEDAQRQEFLESAGFQVIRFKNQRVLTQTETVVEEIAAICRQALTRGISPLHRSGEGPGER